jgi:hypothetical protein
MAVTSYSDAFLVETFADSDGRAVTCIYGYGGRGTAAGAAYLSEVVSDPCRFWRGWVIGRWLDGDLDGKADPPGSGDTYQVVARDAPWG